MNPLPFFPPPARAFSQNISTSPPSRDNGKSGRNRAGSSFGFSGGASLRHTLSLTGNRDRQGHPTRDPRNRVVSTGSNGGSGSSSPDGGSSRPGTPGDRPTMTRVATSFAAPSSNLANAAASASASTSASISPVPSSSSSSASGTASPAHASKAAAATGSGAASPVTAAAPSSPVPSASASSSTTRKAPSRSTTMPLSGPSGRTGTNLPKGLTFDWVRPSEVAQCHVIERASFIPDDRASKDRMQLRQKLAPHLFLGAYIPVPPPKVAGPLSVGHQSTPRRIIGYINATAAASMSARALSEHLVSNEEEGIEAWMVCLHAIVVDEPFRRKGLGLRLLEEFMMRLRRAEEGRGEVKKGDLEKAKGYECVGLICHEETLPFFLKAGFKIRGPSHIRAGSGDWIELRRYIQHAHQQQADEKQRVQEKEAEEQRTKRAASMASSYSSTSSSNNSRVVSQPEKRKTSLHVLTEGDGAGYPGMTASPTSESDTSASVIVEKATPKATEPANDGAGNGKGAGLAGFTQADLLAALSASTPSYKPGTNPSQPFSSILGQTLAGKTFVEDAFLALEARMVKKAAEGGEGGEEGGTNLAEIWCPREECGCKLVAKGMAMWELAESGPLSQPDVGLPQSSSLPPTPQPPPAPASHIRALKERRDGVRSTLPGAPPSAECLTPIRPFWSVVSAMSFDNIAFSKDAEWRMPTSSGGGDAAGSAGEDETTETVASGATTPAAAPARRRVVPPIRRSTFLSGGGGDKSGSKGSNSKRPTSPPERPSSPPGRKGTAPFGRGGAGPGLPISSGSPASPQRDTASSTSPTTASGSDPTSAPAASTGPALTVKYLLCPNCDVGPLGYTIVPESLKAGKMGLQVGEGINSANSAESVEKPREIQIFLLAAERVRYRYVK